MSKEIQIKQECCGIWNNLKDKTKMIDYLIESKQQIADLEAKLVEKDAELEKWSTQYANAYVNRQNALIAEKVELQHQLAEKEKEQNQIAIDQLEKVKEKLLEELQNVTVLLDPLEYEDYHEFIGCGRGYKNSIEEIDNQIKEIKGEV